VPTPRVVGDDLPKVSRRNAWTFPIETTQELPHLGQLIPSGAEWPLPFHHRQHGLREARKEASALRACGIEAGYDRGLLKGRQVALSRIS